MEISLFIIFFYGHIHIFVGKYRRLVCFAVGLAVMVLFGIINAEIMTTRTEWFRNLVGMAINGKVHAVLWFFIYGLQGATVGNFLYHKNLRKTIYLPFLVLILLAIWCFVFFRRNNFPLSVALMVLAWIGSLWVEKKALDETPYFVYFYALFVAWQTYLLVVNIALYMFN